MNLFRLACPVGNLGSGAIHPNIVHDDSSIFHHSSIWLTWRLLIHLFFSWSRNHLARPVRLFVKSLQTHWQVYVMLSTLWWFSIIWLFKTKIEPCFSILLWTKFYIDADTFDCLLVCWIIFFSREFIRKPLEFHSWCAPLCTETHFLEVPVVMASTWLELQSTHHVQLQMTIDMPYGVALKNQHNEPVEALDRWIHVIYAFIVESYVT